MAAMYSLVPLNSSDAEPTNGPHEMQGPIRQLPLTMVGIRKAIHMAITTTERDIYGFGNALMQKSRVQPKALLKFMSQVEALIGVGAVNDPESMLRVLNKGAEMDELIGAEYFELQSICSKLILINKLLDEVPERMRVAVEDNLVKYCLSFVEECTKAPLALAEEYHVFIENTKSEIDLEMKKLDTSNSSRRPASVRDYINNHDVINAHMLRWCKTYLNIARLAKRWLRVDHLYPQKLQETVSWITRRKKALQEALKQIKTREITLEGKRMRHEVLSRKGHDRSLYAREERKNLEARDRNVEAARTDLEDKVNRMLQMRNMHLADQAKAEKSASADYHSRHVSLYEGSIMQARRRLQHLNKISEDLQQEQSRCETTAVELDRGSDQRHNDLEELSSSLDGLQQEQAGVRAEMSSLNDQLEVIRRIREIKMHNDTVRKIYKYGYNPGVYHQNRDTTDNLFRMVAPVIGKQWREVYQRLPFDPARDWKIRNLDLDGIDIHNRRLDPDFPMLSYLMLQKWRRLSQAANVDNLLQLLRRMGLAKEMQLEAIQQSVNSRDT